MNAGGRGDRLRPASPAGQRGNGVVLVNGAGLVVGVAEHRVAGAEVDCGDPRRREAGDVGPSALGADPCPPRARMRWMRKSSSEDTGGGTPQPGTFHVDLMSPTFIGCLTFRKQSQIIFHI